MVLCIRPARGWGGPYSIGPRRTFLDAAKGGCWFSAGCLPHDYFLRRPKAGRLHPSSKSGPVTIISCGDLRLVGSARHQKVVQNPHSILSRSGWWLDGVVFQRLHQNPPHIGCCARSGWWPCGSMGWCFAKLHQSPYPVYYSWP